MGAWDEIDASVPSDLAAGQVIGFALMVYDYDSGNRRGIPWTPEATETEDTENEVKALYSYRYPCARFPMWTFRVDCLAPSASWGR